MTALSFITIFPKIRRCTGTGWRIPIEMDGTPYISQPMIKPGGMFTYEFTLNQHGTFFTTRTARCRS